MQIYSIAQHELLKLIGTRRGWISIVALSLVWALVLVYVIRTTARFLANPDTSGILGMILGESGQRFGNTWSTLEVSVYWFVALMILPFFAVLISADQIAADRTRGTLRYLLLRTSRMTLFFSRFAGQMVIMWLMVVLTFFSAVAMTAMHSSENAAAMVADALPVIVNVWLVLMPYVALMALFSVLARSPRQAIIYSIIVWIVVWVLTKFLRSQIGEVAWLDWVMPGAQIAGLLRLDGWETLQLAPVPVAHTIVLLAFGAWAMWRRDL